MLKIYSYSNSPVPFTTDNTFNPSFVWNDNQSVEYRYFLRGDTGMSYTDCKLYAKNIGTAEIVDWFKFAQDIGGPASYQTPYNFTVTHDTELPIWFKGSIPDTYSRTDIKIVLEYTEHVYVPQPIWTSTTFNYTGSAQTFIVPAGVTAIRAECWAAQGGSMGVKQGGQGGYAACDLAVTPSESLQVNVGGTVTNTQNPAFGGGGLGGHSTNDGAAGGGASDIRQGGTALTDRKIVAGAGGGASPNNDNAGGIGGGLTGGDGLGTYYGRGGTQSAGGVAPSPDGFTTGGNYLAPTNGSLGQGGDGGRHTLEFSGGGGGAGFYGGSGAGADASGGGGSSLIGAGGITTSGVRTGHGLIVISYISGYV